MGHVSSGRNRVIHAFVGKGMVPMGELGKHTDSNLKTTSDISTSFRGNPTMVTTPVTPTLHTCQTKILIIKIWSTNPWRKVTDVHSLFPGKLFQFYSENIPPRVSKLRRGVTYRNRISPQVSKLRRGVTYRNRIPPRVSKLSRGVTYWNQGNFPDRTTWWPHTRHTAQQQGANHRTVLLPTTSHKS